jgi:hypothetical protein
MSEPQITWGAGLTPEELAARLAATRSRRCASR